MTKKNNNMELYRAIETPPEWALKEIKAGRLRGKSDISPQWRIEALTKEFGVCGYGWKYEIVKLWTLDGKPGEVAAFAQINLYVKEGDTWSDPIPGIGGSMLVVQESSGPHTDDDAFKKAVTDSISVAFKALGGAAKIYAGQYDTKYTDSQDHPPAQNGRTHTYTNRPKDGGSAISEAQRKRLYAITKKSGVSDQSVKEMLLRYGYESSRDIGWKDYNEICEKVMLMGAQKNTQKPEPEPDYDAELDAAGFPMD